MKKKPFLRFFFTAQKMIDAPHHRDNDQHDGEKADTAGKSTGSCLTRRLFEAGSKGFRDIDFAHVYLPTKSSARGLMVLGSIAGLLM